MAETIIDPNGNETFIQVTTCDITNIYEFVDYSDLNEAYNVIINRQFDTVVYQYLAIMVSNLDKQLPDGLLGVFNVPEVMHREVYLVGANGTAINVFNDIFDEAPLGEGYIRGIFDLVIFTDNDPIIIDVAVSRVINEYFQKTKYDIAPDHLPSGFWCFL